MSELEHEIAEQSPGRMVCSCGELWVWIVRNPTDTSLRERSCCIDNQERQAAQAIREAEEEHALDIRALTYCRADFEIDWRTSALCELPPGHEGDHHGPIHSYGVSVSLTWGMA